MRNYAQILILGLAFLGLSWCRLAGQGPGSEVPSNIGLKMEKGTLREVFDLYARERNLNLILDPSIPKDKTVDLYFQDLPLDEMFDLVVASNNLGVKKFGNNALLVYPLEKATLYKGEPGIRQFPMGNFNVDVGQLKEMLTAQFPDCRFYLDKNNLNSIVGIGSPESLDRADGFFQALTTSLDKPEKMFVPLKNIDTAAAIVALKNFDKNVTIFDSPGKNGVIIVGPRPNEVADLLRKIDEEPGQETKVYELKYQDMSKLGPLIKSVDKQARVISLGDDNKLIVQAKGQTLRFLDQAIAALDKPQKQVLFDFQLVEVDLETLKKLGVQINQQAYTVSEIKGLIDAKIYPFLMNLLKDSKKARILANPKLKVTEHKTARITIGDRIPLEVAATSQTDSGSLLKFNTQLQWVEAGIKFSVANVRVHENTRASLDLKSEVSSVVGYSSKGYPLLRTREAETSLLIGDGETVVLAGLINREDRVTTTKVPYLSDLPILGKIFVTNDRRKVNSEILLFLTPHIEIPVEGGGGKKSTEPRKDEVKQKDPATPKPGDLPPTPAMNRSSFKEKTTVLIDTLRRKIQMEEPHPGKPAEGSKTETR